MTSIASQIANAVRSLPDRDLLALVRDQIGSSTDEPTVNASPKLTSGSVVRRTSETERSVAGRATSTTAKPSRGRGVKEGTSHLGHGLKRTPEQLAAVADNIKNFVASHPGSGAEMIGKHLGLKTAELQRPIKGLLKAGAIRVEGQKRATKYYPAAKRARGKAETLVPASDE